MRRRRTLIGLVVFSGVGVIASWLVADSDLDGRPVTGTGAEQAGASDAPAAEDEVPPYDGLVDPASSGQPFYGSTVDGLLTFRGNPTRSYYGKGPVPREPQVLVRFPDEAMCSHSAVGNEDRVWCGSGWTGQPAVFERDGRRWAVFGAYDRNIHFLDAVSGDRILPDFPTGDIIKGSVSIDPDGYPLVYSGSRDNYVHVVAFDRLVPTELWSLSADAVSPTLWNNDWDGSPLILGDYMVQGGENSQLHIVKLNRGYGSDGKVTVDPELVFNAPGWDDELLQAIGDHQVSIENSVAAVGNTIYFSNGGGLVQGWDLTGIEDGKEPVRTFRFWSGDDTDASIAIDDAGMLYVASEYERGTARSREVGQLQKLDPSKPKAPLVWSIKDLDTNPAGMWATPALHRDVVYVATNGGRLLAADRATGAIRWEKHLPGPTWQSPVVVDDVLVQGDCEGTLHAYDVRDTTTEPPELWSIELGGCIESTPAVFKGRIYVGTRSGFFFVLGDRPTKKS